MATAAEETRPSKQQRVEEPEEAANVIIQFQTPEGDVTGPQLDVPQGVTPAQLEALLNGLLRNDEPSPYSFYVGDDGGAELSGALGAHLLKAGVSVERALRVTYLPQAVFRVRPVARCTASMPGHSEAVLSVCFSPDGARLASGSGDTTVRLWDLGTQLPQCECRGHRNWVLVVAWSPDAKYIASGDMDGAINLWDPKDGRLLGSCTGHKKWITSIAWEPAHRALPARRFVSGSKDMTVRVWDAATRRCLFSMSSHTMAVTAVKWGGEGLIYSAGRDCAINVWSDSEGKLVRTLKGHAHWVNTLALSSEHALRTGAFDHKGRAPSAAAAAAAAAGGGSGAVAAAAAKGSSGGQEDGGKEAAALEAQRAAAQKRYDEATGGRPERLVSGSDDYTMILWCPSAGKAPLARMTGHVQLINHVVFSPDGRWVASASFDKSVKLWDGAKGTFVATLRGHVGPVYQAAWSSDSRLLVSGSKDSTLKVWDLRTRKLMADLPGHADEVFTVDWSPDGASVASGGKDRVLKLWRQ